MNSWENTDIGFNPPGNLPPQSMLSPLFSEGFCLIQIHIQITVRNEVKSYRQMCAKVPFLQL